MKIEKGKVYNILLLFSSWVIIILLELKRKTNNLKEKYQFQFRLQKISLSDEHF